MVVRFQARLKVASRGCSYTWPWPSRTCSRAVVISTAPWVMRVNTRRVSGSHAAVNVIDDCKAVQSYRPRGFAGDLKLGVDLGVCGPAGRHRSISEIGVAEKRVRGVDVASGVDGPMVERFRQHRDPHDQHQCRARPSRRHPRDRICLARRRAGVVRCGPHQSVLIRGIPPVSVDCAGRHRQAGTGSLNP